MRYLLILSLLLNCTGSINRSEARLLYYQGQVKHLTDSAQSLRIELEKSEAYIASATVHQVTRTEIEKERQLKNLTDYKKQIEMQLHTVEELIAGYTDSLSQISSK